MDDDDQDASSGGRRGRPAKAGRLGDEPYRVGKGKPPREHQWKKGCASPNRRGRPTGSTKASSLEKFLDQLVSVGFKNGRQIKKPLREVLNHKLIEQAVEKGNLQAIKLIHDIQFQQRRLGLAGQPMAAELARQREEEEEKREHAKRISASVTDAYRLVGHMKKLGIVEFLDDRPIIQQWVLDEAKTRGFGRKRPSEPPPA